MKRKIRLLASAALLVAASAVLSPRFAIAQTTESQVAQSWVKAVAYLPHTSQSISIERLTAAKAYPVAIYMHGCDGIESSPDNHNWARLMAAEGLLVVMPDSLARTDRRPSCDPKAKKGGLFPAVHGMRLEEIKYASEQIRKQPWFDGKNLFLMGYSEGAIAAVRSTLDVFRGVIAASWTCTNAKAPSFDGIFLPMETPLLTMAHEDDPWVANDTRGTCGQKMAGRTDSRHLAIPGKGHGTYDSREAREEVARFIRRLLSPS